MLVMKGKESCLFVETGPSCIAQASLKLLILLPLPPECWDYGVQPNSAKSESLLSQEKLDTEVLIHTHNSSSQEAEAGGLTKNRRPVCTR